MSRRLSGSVQERLRVALIKRLEQESLRVISESVGLGEDGRLIISHTSLGDFVRGHGLGKTVPARLYLNQAEKLAFYLGMQLKLEEG